MSELTLPATPRSGSPELLKDLRDFIEILRRGWRHVAVSVMVCLTLATIYLAKTKRQYQATARLLVLQQGGRPLNVANNNDPSRLLDNGDDYIPTHASIVSSPRVMRRAIDAIGLQNLPSLATAVREGLDPVEEAIAKLKVVRPDRQAKILRADYRADSREEATRTLEAITESYEKFLEETFQKNNNDVIELIKKAREQLREELKEAEEKYAEFRRGHPIFVDQSGRSFVLQRLEQWNHSTGEAMAKAVQLKAQLELGRKLAGEGIDLWAIAHAITQLGGDANSLLQGLNSLGVMDGGALYIRTINEQRQQLIDRYGLEYSKVQELTKRIEQMRNARNRLASIEARDLLSSIEQSLKAIEAMRVDFSKRFDEDQDKAKQLEFDLLTETSLRENLERQRSLFNTVVDQLKQAQFIGDFSSISSQIIEPPNAPRYPVWPQMSIVLGLALVAGCLIGTGAAVVADRIDQRIRSLAELRQILGLAVLGQIPQVREEQAAAMGEFGLVSHTMPRSPWAEAYRAIRTNIEFLRRNQDLRVILVTSGYSGDGKSVSASNLAVSLAQAGRRILLVDGDLRKPSQHEIHGLTNNRGLTHVLRGLLPVHRVVQRTAVENLELIVTGPEVPNPAELLTSSTFNEFLGEARRSYEIVIIDSSPLLVVTDAAIIGGSVDGVVLIARAGALRHNDAQQVVEMLRVLGTRILGTIVNRTTRDREGYGYGYGYGAYGNRHGSPEAATTASPKDDGGEAGAPPPPPNGRSDPQR
jgi:polysaccharide biosynthesis transport protein